MSIHVSVGLAYTPDVKSECNVRKIRMSICAIHGQQDTDVMLSVEDARMIAALLTTAADNIKDTPNA